MMEAFKYYCLLICLISTFTNIIVLVVKALAVVDAISVSWVSIWIIDYNITQDTKNRSKASLVANGSGLKALGVVVEWATIQFSSIWRSQFIYSIV